MFKKTLCLYLCLSHAIFAAENSGMTVPLQYEPLYGIYTETLKVGNDPIQEVAAIVDTGSSTLVLVADKNYCPSCSSAITKGVITPTKIKRFGTDKAISLSYGSAQDTVMEYFALVQYTDEKKDKLHMKVFVLKESDQPSSIIGMINHDLRKNKVSFTPFLVHLTHNFSKYSELTFVLCGRRGKSYYHVGPIQLPKSQLSSKLVPSEFYTITTSGFYDKNNQSIAKPQNPSASAILDTGTGGFIVVTPELYKPLYEYIYQHAGVKNQTLDEHFWKKNYCIRTNEVDFSALPPLKIGFQNLNDKHSYYLTLLPTSYINRGGCEEGYVRLVFNEGFPPNHPTAMRNHQLRKASGAAPDILIGTSLLDHYALQIHYTKDPHVTFYENQSLCRH